MGKNQKQLRIIAGDDRGRRLVSPRSDRIRPTGGMAREAIFSILADRVPGSDFLDLYAGTGAVGLEALSRGAQTVTLVENDRDAIAVLRENIGRASHSENCRLWGATVAAQCARFVEERRTFDLIFIDPPYNGSGIEIRLLEPILSPNGILIHQRPAKWTAANPFLGTRLVRYDLRRYGKTEISFWTFGENLEEEIQ